MLELITELLSYARKLLPLMEMYMARRPSPPAHDPSLDEFKGQVTGSLRELHSQVMGLHSELETLNQRLKVLDEQSQALQREWMQVADQQRTVMIAVVIAAIAAVGALVTGVIAVVRG